MKFSIPQKFRLSTLLYNKKFAIGISIVLAFSLWLGITMTENPVRERTFTDIKATVSLKGTAAEVLGLDIISDHSEDRFDITVSGPNYIVSSLKADDFSLSVSTIKVNKADEYELELVAQSTSNKSGYTITSINPSTITVKVDYIDEKEFTITPKIIGASASEGLILDTPVISDSQYNTIKIKGPRAEMEAITSVVAETNVNEVLSSTDSFKADIVLCDSDNKILYRYSSDGTVYKKNEVIQKSPLTLSFKSISVTQPISKQKVVPCVPTFENMPDGMTLEDINYTLNVNELTIQGPPDVIDSIDQITTSPIDFREVSKNKYKFDVSAANLPSGVKIVENFEVFNLEINLNGYAEKTINISNINCTGLDDDYTAKISKGVAVKICGPSAVIRKIKSDDLYIFLDLTDKNPGSYTLDVVVKSDVYNNVWQVGTYEATVSIS